MFEYLRDEHRHSFDLGGGSRQELCRRCIVHDFQASGELESLLTDPRSWELGGFGVTRYGVTSCNSMSRRKMTRGNGTKLSAKNTLRAFQLPSTSPFARALLHIDFITILPSLLLKFAILYTKTDVAFVILWIRWKWMDSLRGQIWAFGVMCWLQAWLEAEGDEEEVIWVCLSIVSQVNRGK